LILPHGVESVKVNGLTVLEVGDACLVRLLGFTSTVYAGASGVVE